MADPTTQPAVKRARHCARFFCARGYNALPSRSDRKGPALASYADYWTRPLPASIHDTWTATNIQVMTGAYWRLGVVDRDGDEAEDVWQKMVAHHGGVPETWRVRTGGGGLHSWFALPATLEACPSRRLWGLWDTWGGTRHRGDWLPHREVRLLADHALAIAPPSLHVATGRPYEWLTGPDQLPFPAEAPAWLLALPGVEPPRPAWQAPPRATTPPGSPTRPAGAFPTTSEVLDAIPDKVALARSWGLRIAASRPNPEGWVKCHAFDREDAEPSASLSASSGKYVDMRDGTTLGLFDLAAAMGTFPDWQAAKDDAAARYARA